MSRLRIGTSGWVYRHWRGDFYPPELPQKGWLEHYATCFSTAEINGTFYRLPTQATAARWREEVSADFEFAWKASRFITHMKRLRDAEDSLRRIYAPMSALGEKLGPCLFQLPPQMTLDLPRLTDFLGLLPRPRRHVLEFRHSSWYVDAVFELLTTHDVALCISDHHHAPGPWVATAPFVYVRGHGPGGQYRGAYGEGELLAWADRISAWRREDRDIYVYFATTSAARPLGTLNVSKGLWREPASGPKRRRAPGREAAGSTQLRQLLMAPRPEEAPP